MPLVQPGVRRADGAEPVARLHREPAHGPGGGARRGRRGRTAVHGCIVAGALFGTGAGELVNIRLCARVRAPVVVGRGPLLAVAEGDRGGATR